MSEQSLVSCVGQWQLTGYASIEGAEADTSTRRDDDPDAWNRELDAATDAWLNQTPADTPEFSPAGGLMLTIHADGAYQESGDAGEGVAIISSDGVLGDSRDTYGGELRERHGRLLAFTDENPDGDQRLNDGDTQVTDEFFTDGNELIRVVSMVTDGMYLDRFFYRYDPAN